MLGTPDYVPPTKDMHTYYDDPKEAQKQDIWGLGTVFYEFITGRMPPLPYSAEKVKETLKGYKHGKIKKVVIQSLTLDWRKRPSASKLLKILKS